MYFRNEQLKGYIVPKIIIETTKNGVRQNYGTIMVNINLVNIFIDTS